MADGAVVIYGRGDSLGNLKFFADDLLTTELKGYDSKNVVIKEITRRADFFNFFNTQTFAFDIKELHIYSHAFGGGLSLGYGDPIILSSRGAVADKKKGGSATYLTVLNNEIGTIFGDDLGRVPFSGYQTKIRTLFANANKIKIWGCNSARANWLYSDVDTNGDPVYDINAPGAYYYWRAINEMNTPKLSVAQALANYFKVSTYGASSGSSIQILYKGKWIPTPTYTKKTGIKYVFERDVLRLDPDIGNYDEYKPQ